MRDADARHGVVTQSWSPIDGVRRCRVQVLDTVQDPLAHPVIARLAEKYGKTVGWMEKSPMSSRMSGWEIFMRRKHTSFSIALLALTMIVTAITEAQTMNAEQTLSARQQSIVPIAAFTAIGDMEKLKASLNEGLDAGLNVNEIKEILVQMYAYAGFPRSLNGIHTFMAVMDERHAKGIKDEVGKEAGPLPADMNKDEYGARVRAKLAGLEVIPPPSGYQLFTPIIDTFLKEHLFADIFARDNLDYQSRELATIAALAGMSGTAGQLRFHLGAAMNTGLTEAQMKDFISVLQIKVGEAQAESAQKVLTEVLNNRKY